MKTACDRCAKGASCTLQYDEERRAQCPILDAGDEPLRYRNSEGYSDPTAFFALRNVMKDSKKQQKQPKLRRIPRTQGLNPLMMQIINHTSMLR